MRRCFTTGIVFIAGMIFGAYLSRTASAKPEAGTVVHVTRARTDKQDVSVPGEVIGFACGSAAVGGMANAECYILSH